MIAQQTIDKDGVIADLDSVTGEPLPVLTDGEKRTKRRCELLINAGHKHFMRTCRALARWDRLKLYKDEYSTFEEAVQAKWHMSSGRAYQFIRAADLCTTVHLRIPNEAVARAVLRLSKEDRGPVLLLAHTASDGDIDTGWIKDATETHQEIKATGGKVSNEDGHMVEATASVISHRAERLNRKRQHIRDSKKAKAESQGQIEVFKGAATLHSISQRIDAFTVIANDRDDLVNLKAVRPGSKLWVVVYEVKDEPETNER